MMRMHIALAFLLFGNTGLQNTTIYICIYTRLPVPSCPRLTRRIWMGWQNRCLLDLLKLFEGVQNVPVNVTIEFKLFSSVVICSRWLLIKRK